MDGTGEVGSLDYRIKMFIDVVDWIMDVVDWIIDDVDWIIDALTGR